MVSKPILPYLRVPWTSVFFYAAELRFLCEGKRCLAGQHLLKKRRLHCRFPLVNGVCGSVSPCVGAKQRPTVFQSCFVFCKGAFALPLSAGDDSILCAEIKNMHRFCGAFFLYLTALASLRSSLVLKNFSSSGTRIRQISAAVKPPLYRQKPPWSVGTEVTSR